MDPWGDVCQFHAKNWEEARKVLRELKNILIIKINSFLKEHQIRRKLAEKQIQSYIYKN